MATKAPKAIVEPAVLQWLRDSTGFSVEDVARRVQTSTENVLAWESGDKQPSMAQLRQLAHAFKRSISDFFLPRPMPEPTIPHDFRQLPDSGAHKYSVALRHELRLAYRRRVVALDLAAERELKPEKFSLWSTVNLREDPEEAGGRVRKALGIDISQQRHWRDSRSGYNAWRQRIESLGVLVFQITSVDREQMLGFSLGFDEFPVIGINRKTKPNGRTFTLLHEFTHLMLGESAICDIEEDVFRPPQEQRVEVFCNHVAGAALVPLNELLQHSLVFEKPSTQKTWQDEELAELARFFCVSEEVLLRRMLIAGKTTREFYAEKRRQYAARFQQAEHERREARDLDFKRNVALEAASNLGSFARLVLDSYDSDVINLTDASKFLGVKAERVSAVSEYVR